MQNSLFRYKTVPNSITTGIASGTKVVTRSTPLAGAIVSGVTRPAVNSSSSGTAWPAGTVSPARVALPSHTPWPVNTFKTAAPLPNWAPPSYGTYPNATSFVTKPTGSAVPSILSLPSTPSTSTNNNRVTLILIATLVLVALDLIFVR